MEHKHIDIHKLPKLGRVALQGENGKVISFEIKHSATHGQHLLIQIGTNMEAVILSPIAAIALHVAIDKMTNELGRNHNISMRNVCGDAMEDDDDDKHGRSMN